MPRIVSTGGSSSKRGRKGKRRKSGSLAAKQDFESSTRQSRDVSREKRDEGGRRRRSRRGRGREERSTSRAHLRAGEEPRRGARKASSSRSTSSMRGSPPRGGRPRRGRSRRPSQRGRDGSRLRESSEPSFLKQVRCPRIGMCRKAHSTDNFGAVMMCDDHHHHFKPNDLEYERRKRLEGRPCQNLHSRESQEFITRLCDTHHHHFPEYYLVRSGSTWRLRQGKKGVEREKWRREAQRAMDSYLAKREREEGRRHSKNSFTRSEVEDMLEEEKRRSHRLVLNERKRRRSKDRSGSVTGGKAANTRRRRRN